MIVQYCGDILQKKGTLAVNHDLILLEQRTLCLKTRESTQKLLCRRTNTLFEMGRERKNGQLKAASSFSIKAGAR